MTTINEQLDELAKEAKRIGSNMESIINFSLESMNASELELELLRSLRFRDSFYSLAEKADSINEQIREEKGCNMRPNNHESKLKDEVSFNSVTEDMKLTHEAKNHDYGNSFSDIYKKRGDAYAISRIEEKIKRADVLLEKEAKVNDESLDDSILDAANYLVMWYVERQKEKN